MKYLGDCFKMKYAKCWIIWTPKSKWGVAALRTALPRDNFMGRNSVSTWERRMERRVCEGAHTLQFRQNEGFGYEDGTAVKTMKINGVQQYEYQTPSVWGWSGTDGRWAGGGLGGPHVLLSSTQEYVCYLCILIATYATSLTMHDTSWTIWLIGRRKVSIVHPILK